MAHMGCPGPSCKSCSSIKQSANNREVGYLGLRLAELEERVSLLEGKIPSRIEEWCHANGFVITRAPK
jgi:hypothetical protein